MFPQETYVKPEWERAWGFCWWGCRQREVYCLNLLNLCNSSPQSCPGPCFFSFTTQVFTFIAFLFFQLIWTNPETQQQERETESKWWCPHDSRPPPRANKSRPYLAKQCSGRRALKGDQRGGGIAKTQPQCRTNAWPPALHTLEVARASLTITLPNAANQCRRPRAHTSWRMSGKEEEKSPYLSVFLTSACFYFFLSSTIKWASLQGIPHKAMFSEV